MEQREFIDKLLQIAGEKGVQAEVYARSAESVEAGASGGTLECYESSRSGGLSLRVIADGHCGYAYTERCEDAEKLMLRAIDNARAIEQEDEQPMQHACAYEPVTLPENPLGGMAHGERIDLALSLERETLAQDPRVKRAIYCDVGVSAGQTRICNTNGLEASRSSASAYAYVMPVVEDGGEVQTGFAFRLGAEAADIAGCAQEAVQNALDKLHASSVPSGDYRVLLTNQAMADLLEAFAPMFSAEEAQKGCSLLSGREGERIGADCVSIIDDPFHPIAPRAFDDEGTPSKKKNVVENGVLTTLLHNLKTAAKAGTQSTGNARRASAASPIGAAPSIFYIAPGTESFEALVERLQSGLIITELAGLHAGLSTVSGDFSLKAAGRLVEDGRIGRAVNDITVAGNFLTLLTLVEAVADDLRFVMPGGFYTASPSLLISTLAVAGS